MTPKDPSITSVGSHNLSVGDIAKLQAAYGCDGTSQTGGLNSMMYFQNNYANNKGRAI